MRAPYRRPVARMLQVIVVVVALAAAYGSGLTATDAGD